MPATATMTHSAKVRRRIELTCVDMQHAFAELWDHGDLARLYPAFLIQQHQVVRASVPLMEAALAESTRRAGTDPVAAHLAAYFAQHIDEERDHDAWTLDDLAAVGFDPDEVVALAPLPTVASLVGSQYYWLHHHHPVALMGYIAVLEGSPPSAAHIQRLKDTTGLPDEAFRTYEFHGRVDPHHADDLNRAFDDMPLTERHLGIIGMSATHTGAGVADCIRSLDLIAAGIRPRHS